MIGQQISGLPPIGGSMPLNCDQSGNLIISSSSGGGAGVPTQTSVKTKFAVTSNGTIPAGFISAQFYVGSGATVVIDGIPIPAGSGVYYAPASKLHSAITYTVSGGTLYFYYEV